MKRTGGMMEGIISEAAEVCRDTLPYIECDTVERDRACAVCGRGDSDLPDDTLQIEVEGESVDRGTPYGDFVAELLLTEKLNSKFCIHGTTLSLKMDAKFLATVLQIIVRRFLDVDRPWARKIAEQARLVVGFAARSSS